MRMHALQRTELLLGRDAFANVAGANVLVVGLGGVGSYAAEALARAGVQRMTIVDFDRVCLTNINRQLHATRHTVGQSKAALMEERIRAIQPKAEVRALPLFYDASTRDAILDTRYDAVIDGIDNLAAKLDLLQTCVERGLPVFASMGAGSRLDPTRVRVTDIRETHTDPFARLVRVGLRDRGITQGVTCVWTDEPPQALDRDVQDDFVCICPDKANSPNSCDRRFQVQGTVPWMPPIFGLTLAATAVRHLAAAERVAPAASPTVVGLADRLPIVSQRAMVDPWPGVGAPSQGGLE
jgi:tRNA A37 threonylcarbamoyladenosine dehydratase